MGQISKVTEESEAGTNLVMEFLENVLNTVSKQQGFIKDIKKVFHDNPSAINIDEALTFSYDSLCTIEENIFNAMDAFQFQDIGRQKLMKVMYTLSCLNEYLNELLGGEAERTKDFGHKIESKTMDQDKDKTLVDDIVQEFSSTSGAEKGAASVDDIVAGFQKSQPPEPQSPPAEDSVDDIVANFQKSQQAPTPPEPAEENVDDIVANFQKSQQAPAPPAPAEENVDDIVANFQKSQQAPAPPPSPEPAEENVDDIVANFRKTQQAAPPPEPAEESVDDIVANFQKTKQAPPAPSTASDNDDVDSIIAEFQSQNPGG
ncbi:MAG: hypothetical protein GY765_37150 [bacterium]|nr:hypothetical protein [bacterium]